MPGPLDAFERIDTLPGNPLPPIAQPPPPPGPSGILANFGQAFSGERLVARSDRMDAETLRLHREYGPILDALGLPGSDNPAMFSDESVKGEQMLQPSSLKHGITFIGDMATRAEQEELIAAELRRRRQAQKDFLPGVPDNVGGLHDWMLQREAQRRAAAEQRVARTSGFGGTLGSLAGGAFEFSIDTPNLLALPIGGGGRTVATKILTEGLAMGSLTAAEQPIVAQNRAKLGEDYTAGDFFGNVGSAALGGAIFRGGFEGAGGLGRAMGRRARSAFPDWARQRDADAFGRAMQRAVDLGSFAEHELPSVAARMMSPDFGILSADAARAQLRREIEAGTIDDRAVAEHFRLAVPEDRRTPDEKAALAGIGTDADLAEASPYRPSPEGDLAHQANFAAAVRRILDGAPHPSAAADVPAGASVPRGAPPKPPAVVMAPNDVVRFVINDLEGGAKVVHYNHADGGTTKYGIAQADHPGVDVANLTEDQAAAIARRKYWLPEFYQARPDVAAIAFDAHYIHGDPAFARRLAAMDDPAQALRAYRAKLNEIADTVPGKAKYKKGWNARVDRLGRRLGIEDAPFAPPELRPEYGGPVEATVAPDAVDGDFMLSAASVAPEGEPGISIDHTLTHEEGGVANVVFRDEAGRAKANLQIPLDEETARNFGGVITYVDPAFRRQGIATRLYDFARQQGLPVDAHSGRGDLTPDGAAFVNADRAKRYEASLPPSIEVKPRSVPPRRGPVHLLQAIADAGGLRDDEGHDLIKGRGIPKYVLGAGTIVRRESGLSVDAMGEHLWEDGWFGPPSTSARPSEADVLDLLEQGVKRKLYRPEEQAAVDARAAARAGVAEEEDARLELASHAEEHGLHLDDRTLDEALAHRAAGETVEGAVSRAVHDAAYRDARGAATLDRLDEEEASGWKGQVESIEHDLRMDAENDPRLAELFADLDREEKGAAELRACMAPKVEIAG